MARLGRFSRLQTARQVERALGLAEGAAGVDQVQGCSGVEPVHALQAHGSRLGLRPVAPVGGQPEQRTQVGERQVCTVLGPVCMQTFEQRGTLRRFRRRAKRQQARQGGGQGPRCSACTSIEQPGQLAHPFAPLAGACRTLRRGNNSCVEVCATAPT